MKRYLAALCLTCALWAQHRVDPGNMYERCLAIVPMIGKGTREDPRRPMYAPVANQVSPVARAGIMAFQFIPSDDGNFALVEFVAQNRSAFKPILADPTVKAFIKGQDGIANVIAQFKTLRKDFTGLSLGVRVQ